MLRLDKIIKPWKESAALNDHINLYGFWNETAFLTKSGDLGMVLQVQGVDYESLDSAGQEYAVKRLESALKAFGQGFHVYQYLFKANRPEIPFATRSIWHQVVGNCKTEASAKPVPMDSYMAEDLLRWRRQRTAHQTTISSSPARP